MLAAIVVEDKAFGITFISAGRPYHVPKGKKHWWKALRCCCMVLHCSPADGLQPWQKNCNQQASRQFRLLM